MFQNRMNHPKIVGVVLCCAIASLSLRNLSAEIGLTSQPEPLGYPFSVDDPADTIAEEEAGSIWPPAKRADDLQVPAGFDPARSTGFSENPKELLSWFKEPAPASCCDRNIVDRLWMGPGELAYHKAPNHKPCTRDHTRVFRTEFPGRLWFSTEYLIWATTGQAIPPLITSSPLVPITNAGIGVLGQPTTSTLFGGTSFDGPMRSGARLTAGFWFTPQEDRGIEASWFGLAITKKSFDLSTTGGNPYLARPYIDAITGQPAAVVIPEPGLQPGPTGQPTPTLLDQTADAALRSQFGSVNVLYRYNTTKGEDFHRRYWAGGFRYLMLEDQLAVNLSSSVSTGATSFDTYIASDSFRTLNQFYGGEFGMIEKWWRDRWSLQVLGKVALGATTVSTRINGVTTETATTNAGTTTTGTFPGGVLAQPTNPGNEQSLFAAAGEFGVTADYAIWSQFRLSVGYSLIYWTTVGRVTDQIDPSVNPQQFGGGAITSGPSEPSFNLWTTGFLAQGVNVGLEYQF